MANRFERSDATHQNSKKLLLRMIKKLENLNEILKYKIYKIACNKILIGF